MRNIPAPDSVFRILPIPHSSFRIQHSRKRLRQQTRRELRDAGLGCGEARLQPVGVGEEGFDAADDFVLFG